MSTALEILFQKLISVPSWKKRIKIRVLNCAGNEVMSDGRSFQIPSWLDTHRGSRESHKVIPLGKKYPVGLSWQSIWNPHYSSHSLIESPCWHVNMFCEEDGSSIQRHQWTPQRGWISQPRQPPRRQREQGAEECNRAGAVWGSL